MKTPPDTSVGALMDARDRQERFGAWITLGWLLAPYVAFRIAVLLLPPVPTLLLMPSTEERITSEEVHEPLRLDEWKIFPYAIGDGMLHLAERSGAADFSEECYLLDLQKREVVRRIDCDSRRFLPAGGRLYVGHGEFPDTGWNQFALALSSRWDRSPFEPDVWSVLYEYDPFTVDLHRIIRTRSDISSLSISPDRTLALLPAEVGGSSTLPSFLRTVSELVSLPENRRIGLIPLPGPVTFISNQTALSISPQGVARVDLDSLHSEVIFPLAEGVRLDPRYPRDYTHLGRRFLGALFWNPQDTSFFALRIELSDPPRIERFEVLVPESVVPYDEESWAPKSPVVLNIDFTRELVISIDPTRDWRDPTRWLLIDAKSGRTILERDALEVGFVDEYLCIGESPVELPGPMRPGLGTSFRLFMYGWPHDYSSLHAPPEYRYLNLDDIVREARNE